MQLHNGDLEMTTSIKGTIKKRGDNSGSCLDFTADKTTVHYNEDVTFTPTGKFIASGTPTFLWDFGDGTVVSNNTKTISHIYTTAGTYTPILTVIDPSRFIQRYLYKKDYITVQNILPDITLLSIVEHPIDMTIYVDSEDTVRILTIDEDRSPIKYYTIIKNTITQYSFDGKYGLEEYLAIAPSNDGMIYGYATAWDLYLHYDYVFLLNKNSYQYLPNRPLSCYPDRKLDCMMAPYSYKGFDYSIYLTYPDLWITNVNFYKKKNGVTISSVIKSIDYRDYPQLSPDDEYSYYMRGAHFIPETETIHVVLCDNLDKNNCGLYVKMKMS